MIETAWIIDDDDIYRYGFRKFVTNKLLCKALFDFDNASQAINILTSSNTLTLPEVIFLSVDMKNMSCWQFMSAFEGLKNQYNLKKTVIYLLTSSINYRDIERMQNHPDITDYIIKPLDARQFYNAFQNCLLSKIA